MRRTRLKRDRRSSRQDSEDHILPLINIVFLLLAFFLIAGQIKKISPIPITSPESISEARDKPNDVTVQIDPAGDLLIEGVLADEATLVELFESRDPEEPLRVNADTAANAGEVLRHFQELRRIGWETVILVTTRPKS